MIQTFAKDWPIWAWRTCLSALLAWGLSAVLDMQTDIAVLTERIGYVRLELANIKDQLRSPTPTSNYPSDNYGEIQ